MLLENYLNLLQDKAKENKNIVVKMSNKWKKYFPALLSYERKFGTKIDLGNEERIEICTQTFKHIWRLLATQFYIEEEEKL